MKTGSREFFEYLFVFLVALSTIGLSACSRSGNQPSAPSFFFIANDGIHGYELWKTDGTEVGTVMVKDIIPGPGSGAVSFTDPIAVGNRVYFKADDGIHGDELWKSDGSEADTVMVKDINPISSSIIIDMHGTAVSGELFFRADDGVHGLELWKSDGTNAGTLMVKDIRSASGTETGWHLTESIAIGNNIYFRADDSIHGYELWISDGTDGGTRLVKDINIVDSTFPDQFGSMGNRLYFWATYGISGNTELWTSDGTETGTIKFDVDIFPTSTTSNKNFVNFNNLLFFGASNQSGGTGDELWKSDGTEVGTVLVKDINPGWGSSSPDFLSVMNGMLFFTSDDGLHGSELWKTDGTDMGTVMVKDIYPDNATSEPLWLTVVNGVLFFAANDGTNGLELWKSDGTEAGTVMVKDINPSAGASSAPIRLRALNGVLYFSANDGVHGWELWKSDGTEAGTMMVKDICPGPCSNGW